METTGMVAPFCGSDCGPPAGPVGTGRAAGHRPPRSSAGSRELDAAWYPRLRSRRASRYACEVRRQRRLDLDPLAGEGMREGEPRRVQELARERRVRRRRRRGRPTTGRSIAARWTRIWCIRPVSSRTRSSACRPRSSLDLEVRHRLARRVGVERDARRVAAVAPDRRLDPAGPRARTAPRRARGRCARARARGRAADSRRCASSERATTIRPEVSRSSRWTIPAARARRPRRLPGERVDERPAAWPAPGMDDEPRRLVDHEQVLVLPDDRAAAGGAGGIGALRRRRRADRLAALEPVALRRGAPSTRAPARDSPLGRRARAEVVARNRSSRSPAASAGRPCHRAATSSGRRGCRGSRSAADERDEQDHDADDDEAVREVERRPVAEVDEVGHVVAAGCGRRGSRGCRRSEARAPPAAPGAARPSGRSRRASRVRRAR